MVGRPNCFFQFLDCCTFCIEFAPPHLIYGVLYALFTGSYRNWALAACSVPCPIYVGKLHRSSILFPELDWLISFSCLKVRMPVDRDLHLVAVDATRYHSMLRPADLCPESDTLSCGSLGAILVYAGRSTWMDAAVLEMGDSSVGRV